MRGYYFTLGEFAISDIALRRIKVSRFQDLNDPFELLAVDIGERDARAPIRDARNRMNERKGLICFSRAWKNPLLWGHYADKHRGVCLGFDVPDDSVKEVIYAKRPLKIAVSSRTGRPKLTAKDIKRLQRTKFVGWKYEDEVRYFVELKEVVAEGPLHFKEFLPDMVLREVILGPNCKLPIDGVRKLVKALKPNVVVIQSRIAFRSFKVVENKVVTRRGQNGAAPQLIARR
jgi:hypothetical protein